MQFDFLRAVLEQCREANIHTALDTSGFAPQERLLSAAGLSNLVLYDLKLIDDEKHQKYTGVSNGLILENLKALSQSHDNIWIRLPIIPGINDAQPDLEAAARFILGTPNIRKVTLLPYHQTGEAKLDRLGRPNRLQGVAPPSTERIDAIARYFKQLGVDAKVGG